MPSCVESVYSKLICHNMLVLVTLGMAQVILAEYLICTFEQTLSDLLCFVTHPRTVEEVEGQRRVWHWVLTLLPVHY